MSVQILTGYTGERHITPYMDATVNRGIFGEEGCILPTGSQMAAAMPDINTFNIADGAFSIQGHIGITTGESLTVDTCATGMNRIDLVVARFEHNAETNIDTMSIVLIKGEETSSAYPITPSYRTGSIAEGANVDLPLFKITLSGSTVTFGREVYIVAGGSIKLNLDDTKQIVRLVGGDTNRDVCYRATRTDTGVGAMFGVGSGGINHGVWSDKNGHWIIYEDDKGVARISASDLRIAGHSSAIGAHINGYLSANKTCASGKWYALCSVVLPPGVWIILAGARWNANANGNRQCNISYNSADPSQNISVAPATNSVTSSRFATVVTPKANTRYYLNVYQNSGSNIVCPASGNGYGNFLTAVRIL